MGGGAPAASVDADVPRSAVCFGLRIDPMGTHLSRTIMLEDLGRLLADCPLNTTAAQYRAAIAEHNLLGKPTASARKISFDRLRELYALDPDKLIFRALHELWPDDPSAQPLITLLCATARDPILRAMTPWLLELLPGAAVTPQMVSDEAERQFPGKFAASTLQALGRNAASSWEQAGLLRGRNKKERARAQSRPTAVAYALLLGDLCGRRGSGLFSTVWARLLDAPTHLLREQAITASQRGWIEYRAAGDVVEVSFRHLMRELPGDGE